MGIHEKLFLYGNNRSIGLDRPPLHDRILDGCGCFVRNHFAVCAVLAFAMGSGAFLVVWAIWG